MDNQLGLSELITSQIGTEKQINPGAIDSYFRDKTSYCRYV